MKKVLITLALALVTVLAFGQKKEPVGVRMEVVELEQNNNTHSIFSYKDEDGTFGYYLSLGHQIDLIEISGPRSTGSISHVDETCIYLGANKEEVLATLDSMKELFAQPIGASAVFPCRKSNLVGLGEASTTTCLVIKPVLSTKRLSFTFISGGHTAEARLTKNALKSLRWSFKTSPVVKH